MPKPYQPPVVPSSNVQVYDVRVEGAGLVGGTELVEEVGGGSIGQVEVEVELDGLGVPDGPEGLDDDVVAAAATVPGAAAAEVIVQAPPQASAVTAAAATTRRRSRRERRGAVLRGT